MDKKVSIKDIAKHVGVSTALVSYVLNNKEKEARVGMEIAARIREAAQELNYQPNLIARGLKSGRTRTLGFLVADISNPFFSNIARIIEDEAGNHGYTVIFGSSDENAGKSQQVISAFLNRQVDGLIIAPASGTQLQLQSLVKQRVPVVLIDRYFPELNIPSIHSNNFEASYNAVSHLVKAGFNRIAMVAYANDLHHTQERKRGYLQALKDHKIQAKGEWLLEIVFEHLAEELDALLNIVLTPTPSIDAIFFSTNSLAVPGLKKISGLGLKVPDQIAVVSFDETDAFDIFYSPVSYVKQDLATIGKSAVNMLLKQVAGEPIDHNHVEVAAQLIVRESCGSRLNMGQNPS